MDDPGGAHEASDRMTRRNGTTGGRSSATSRSATEPRARDGRRAVRRAAAVARQAHRARAARPAARSGHVGRVRVARRPHGRGPRRPLPRRRRRGHRHRRDRRPAGCGRGVRLHGDGGVDGRASARTRSRGCARHALQPAHPDRVAARLRGRAHPVDERLDVRGRGRAVPRAGRDERRRADGRGDARSLRGRHRVHPRARRLRADGEGHVVDGARRPPPREGGGRGGRHRGGDGRLGGAHQDLGRRRPRGRRRRRVPARSSASTCRSSRSTTASAPPVQRDDRSRRPPGRGALRHRADRASPRVRHAQGGARDRRRRRRVLDEAGVGEEPRHRPRAHSAASRSASSRTSRWCSAARST